MDFKQIEKLIEIVSKSNLTDVVIESEDIKIKLKKETEKIVYEEPKKQEIRLDNNRPIHDNLKEKNRILENKKIIKSPMVGTFYVSSSPDAEPFVKVGDVINQGETVCIIEAMKLMNEIESEYNGRITKVLVENEQMVEYGQELFELEEE